MEKIETIFKKYAVSLIEHVEKAPKTLKQYPISIENMKNIETY
jgi:hypothetical protein